MSGAFQTIAINLGNRDGVESGNILRIRRNGDVIADKKEKDPLFTVTLPDEQDRHGNDHSRSYEKIELRTDHGSGHAD